MKGRLPEGWIGATSVYVVIYGGVATVVLGWLRDDATLVTAGTILTGVGLLTLFGASIYALGSSVPQIQRRWPMGLILPQAALGLAAALHTYAGGGLVSALVAFGLLLLLLAIAGAVSHDEPLWSHDASAQDAPRHPPILVTWSAELWRGQTRAAPTLLAGSLLATLVLGVAWVCHALIATAVARRVAGPTAAVGSLVVIVTLSLAWSIVQTNRPQRLVSPHLRHEPGRRQELAGPRR
jgi:hypothetical protein